MSLDENGAGENGKFKEDNYIECVIRPNAMCMPGYRKEDEDGFFRTCGYCALGCKELNLLEDTYGLMPIETLKKARKFRIYENDKILSDIETVLDNKNEIRKEIFSAKNEIKKLDADLKKCLDYLKK